MVLKSPITMLPAMSLDRQRSTAFGRPWCSGFTGFGRRLFQNDYYWILQNCSESGINV